MSTEYTYIHTTFVALTILENSSIGLVFKATNLTVCVSYQPIYNFIKLPPLIFLPITLF